MWHLARRTVRHHLAGSVGTLVVVALASLLLTAAGVLGESAVRGGVGPDRYAVADVVVTTARPGGPLAALDAAAPAPLTLEAADRIAAVDGVRAVAAEADVALLDAEGRPVTAHDGALVAASGTGLSGRLPAGPGEVAVESGSGYRLGQEITLRRGALPAGYTVVGVLDRDADDGGRPAHVYLSGEDVVRLWPAAADRTSVLAVWAEPGVDGARLAERIEAQVAGVDAVTGRARGAAEFPDAGQAAGTLGMLVLSFVGIALVVVVLVVASTSALAVRQRHRQVALLRALGATPAQIRAAVTREVLLVGVAGAVVGAVPGLAAAPPVRAFLVRVGFLPPDFDLAVSPFPAVGAAAAVLAACLVAARIAARRPARTAPVAALREAEVESSVVGPVRMTSAVVCAALGVLAGAGQFLLPGAVGSAVSVSAGLLFVVALALGGPPVVHGLAVRAGRLPMAGRGAAVPLALANSRGFSHRLTAAVVPLTLAIVLGVVQIASTEVLSRAGTHELTQGLGGDVVVTAGAGLAPEVVERIATTPGVDAATTLTAGHVYLGERDPELAGVLDLWEPVGLLVVDPEAPAGLIDPGVTAGSLAELARPGTVAVSSDARIEQDFVGVGGHVRARFADGPAEDLEVVAVYDRGLGFGETLVGPATWAPHASGDLVDAVVVSVASGAEDGVAGELAAGGLTVLSTAEHAALVAGSVEPVQRVSAAMLAALVVFVVLAAANSLAMATLARRPEFRFYRLLGAARGQVARLALAEAGIVAALAVGLGLAITMPVVAVVSLGALGSLPPAGVGIAFVVLAGVVVAVAVVGIAGTAARMGRRG